MVGERQNIIGEVYFNKDSNNQLYLSIKLWGLEKDRIIRLRAFRKRGERNTFIVKCPIDT